ncbi:UDP-2,3-diacylglucosamine diphosphatase LpxI [bacterium]|nr:UDP-2,3-diacylglucosamine diphosphatase LpxI [bacterium]MBU0900201.1 UDP-2,3-diacylglucosamine diphosphatase LpxI [bacterium]MBU1154028.1 UDP-2,3-diacylglucosamine diphosphatase LpxI [bacterium]
MRRIGIIAGEGVLPLMLAEELKKQGLEGVAICLTPELSNQMEKTIKKVYEIKIGEVEKIVKTLKLHEVKELVMIGKVRKQILYEDIVLDQRGILLLSNLVNKNDDTILKAIVNEFEREGIKIIDQTKYLKRILPAKGILSERKPNLKEYEDINYGWEVAKKVAFLDIGQTVIVKEKAVIAIEAIEGTNKAILRAGELAKAGTVVVKVSKPQQDFRFDVPTVGPETIKAMLEVKAKVLAIEAERTLLVEREKVKTLVDDGGIALVVI